MKRYIKKVFFIVIVASLIFTLGMVIKLVNFEKLEGYMYAFAAGITDSSTSSNATSSNATSSNATSSNATSSNATSSNATNNKPTTINVVNTQQPNQNINTDIPTDIKENIPAESEETKEEIKNELVYNNSEITQDIIEKIANNAEIQSIIINIDENKNVTEKLFAEIKGKDIKLTINSGENQIIFNGNNVTNPKEINAEISYNLVSEDTLLKEIVQKGVVINFADNGELPGIAKIRIKATDEMKKTLDMNSILIYHYDEKGKELTKLTEKAIYDGEGYIVFSLNHNSKYLFVSELIEEKEYTVATNQITETENEVSFLESNKMYIIILGISVLAIIVVTVIIVLSRKKSKNF